LNIASLGMEIADVETRAVRPDNGSRNRMRVFGSDVDIPLVMGVTARIVEKVQIYARQ
jgi:hypothetical protein